MSFLLDPLFEAAVKFEIPGHDALNFTGHRIKMIRQLAPFIRPGDGNPFNVFPLMQIVDRIDDNSQRTPDNPSVTQ